MTMEEIRDVQFFGFATPDGRDMGHVGIHADGRIFVSARLHPGGIHECVMACAEAHSPIVWRSAPDDLLPYCESTWLRKTIAALSPDAWQLKAITAMEDGVRFARATRAPS